MSLYSAWGNTITVIVLLTLIFRIQGQTVPCCPAGGGYCQCCGCYQQVCESVIPGGIFSCSYCDQCTGYCTCTCIAQFPICATCSRLNTFVGYCFNNTPGCPGACSDSLESPLAVNVSTEDDHFLNGSLHEIS